MRATKGRIRRQLTSDKKTPLPNQTHQKLEQTSSNRPRERMQAQNNNHASRILKQINKFTRTRPEKTKKTKRELIPMKNKNKADNCDFSLYCLHCFIYRLCITLKAWEHILSLLIEKAVGLQKGIKAKHATVQTDNVE